MNLRDATCVAAQLLSAMEPYCGELRVAGSIRRQKPEVKDIEIVATALWRSEPDPADLFGELTPVNLLHRWALRQQGKAITWIKPGTPDPVPPAAWEPWQIRHDGKYWRGIIETEGAPIKLDCFLCDQSNFGLILAIRTGPWQWSRRLVTPRAYGGMLPDGFAVYGGMLWRDGSFVPVPTEDALFEILGMDFVEPEARE